MQRKPSRGGTIQERIYSTFAEVARTIGYSPIHGRIIGALLVNRGELSLQTLARETGYSISMVSLSLDLLEIMGIVRKSRKPGDRNLYISLQGDILETLKNAIVMRISKSIDTIMKDFRNSRDELGGLPPKERKKVKDSIRILEGEIKRLESYVDMLSRIELP
jgi:DNA-binding transcriptional regulator GbsR (MarR family)